MSDMKTVFAKNPNCVEREVGDGIIIMLPEGEVTHTLGTLEGFIWGHINGINDQQTIMANILDQYDVPEDVAMEDLLAFMAQLLNAGLIEAI